MNTRPLPADAGEPRSDAERLDDAALRALDADTHTDDTDTGNDNDTSGSATSHDTSAIDRYRATAALLAETAFETGEPAPIGLRERILAAALSQRAPGRPVADATTALTSAVGDAGDAPAARTPAQTYRHSIDVLDALLASLTPDEWHRPAVAAYGTVRDLVAHLVGVETLVAGWVRADTGPVDDHVGGTRAWIEMLAGVTTTELHARWRATAMEAYELLRAAAPTQPVQCFTIPASAEGTMILRSFELWTHAEDICRATGRPLLGLDAARASIMSAHLMAVYRVAVAWTDTAPAKPHRVRFVLTGPGGGVHDTVLSDDTHTPDVSIVIDTVDLCRLAAARASIDGSAGDVVFHVEGDETIGRRVLACAGAFSLD